MQTWEEALKWEKDWHGMCENTYNEETKQYIYANKMGLNEFKCNYYGQVGWDFKDRRLLDIGGGPHSILLKSKAKDRIVIDPCDYPHWVSCRYHECGIKYIKISGEKYNYALDPVDITLIYNCLQHVKDPELIIQNALKNTRELRIFEWIDCGISEGHIHDLKEEKLDEWLGGYGRVEVLNQNPCCGHAYYGIFKGKI